MFCIRYWLRRFLDPQTSSIICTFHSRVSKKLCFVTLNKYQSCAWQVWWINWTHTTRRQYRMCALYINAVYSHFAVRSLCTMCMCMCRRVSHKGINWYLQHAQDKIIVSVSLSVFFFFYFCCFINFFCKSNCNEEKNDEQTKLVSGDSRSI